MRSLQSRQLKKCLYETLIIMNQCIKIGGSYCFNCYDKYNICDMILIEYPICGCVNRVCSRCEIGLKEYFKKVYAIK